jgi:hypothetical protein
MFSVDYHDFIFGASESLAQTFRILTLSTGNIHALIPEIRDRPKIIAMASGFFFVIFLLPENFCNAPPNQDK